jgi:hypothetical protein
MRFLGTTGGHFGGPGQAFGRGFSGQHFAAARGHFDHDRRFGRRSRWDYGSYDYGCGYGYPYYNPYSCYLPTY